MAESRQSGFFEAPPVYAPPKAPSSSSESRWSKKKKEAKEPEVYPTVIEGLKRIYASKIKPLEKEYDFDKFHSPLLRDSDFDAKPMVLLIGQYSTGKTTFIRYLLEREYPGAHIGPEPTTDRFVAVMHGNTDLVTPGNALTVQADKPFGALSKFGNDFLNKFQSSQSPAPILEDVTFIDTPGVLSGEKQRIGRSYDFVKVIEWFAERADMILLLFDAHKLDISDEFKRSIEGLKGQGDKIKIVLNKADMISGQQLMRVYGALMWSLGKVLQTPEVTRVYLGSFWDQPYQNEDYRKLFEAEQGDLLKDLYDLPKYAAIRKINELVKRSRLAKVHAYLISHLKNEMPAVFGKQKKQDDLIDKLKDEFFKVHQKYQLPVGDFPDINKFREVLKVSDFTKFNKLNQKMIDHMDQVLGEDIPKLIKQFPQEQIRKNPFEDSSNPFDASITGSEGPITSEDRAKFQELFFKLNPVNGKASGKVCGEFLSQSKLPRDQLSKIWGLSDRDNDGFLDEEEFAIAMYFVNLALAGATLPLRLPPELQKKKQQQEATENVKPFG